MSLQCPALCDYGKSRAPITVSEALCDLDSTRLPVAFPLLLPLAEGATLALLPGLSIQVYFASRMLGFLSLLLELKSPSLWTTSPYWNSGFSSNDSSLTLLVKGTPPT